MPTINAVSKNDSCCCCDQIVEALGRCWTWIVNTWHRCVDKVFQVVDAVAFVFFRIVSCFAPQWATNMEIAYGYVATWYARHKASIAQEIAKTTVAGLEKANRGLHTEMLQNAEELAALKVDCRQMHLSNQRLKTERIEDIRARTEAESQCEQLGLEARFSAARLGVLNKENTRMQQGMQEIIAERAPIVAQNRAFATDLGNLQREIEMLRAHTEFVEAERDVLGQSITLLQKMKVPGKPKSACRTKVARPPVQHWVPA